MASRVMDRSDYLDHITLSIAGIPLNDAHTSDAIIRSFPQPLVGQMERSSHPYHGGELSLVDRKYQSEAKQFSKLLYTNTFFLIQISV